MLRLDLQFYAFFMVILCGVVLGLLFDLLRVARGHYRLSPWIAGGADLLFWIVATVALAGALFYGNWGELRLYVLVGLLVGLGLYYWLASPIVIDVLLLIIGILEWLATLLLTLVLKLVWLPVKTIVGLLVSALVVLWRWAGALADFIWGMLEPVFGWLVSPFIGPYRFCKLHYLLAKRRIRRAYRRLFGPSTRRRH